MDFMKKYKFSLWMLFLAVVSLVCGLYLGFVYDYKWLGNFGSLIVLFGAMSEYLLMQLELKVLYFTLKGQAQPMDGGKGIPDLSPTNCHRCLANTSHLVIIVGTFIWGFGECFLEWYISST